MACNNLEQQITSVAIAHTYWMTFKQSVKADRQREGGWEGQSDMCGVTTLFHLPGIKICSFSKDIPLKSHDLSQYTVNRQSISAFQWHACGDVFRRSTKKKRPSIFSNKLKSIICRTHDISNIQEHIQTSGHSK